MIEFKAEYFDYVQFQSKFKSRCEIFINTTKTKFIEKEKNENCIFEQLEKHSSRHERTDSLSDHFVHKDVVHMLDEKISEYT